MLKALPFLGSTRFWAIVAMGLALWFGELGWFPLELVAFIKLVTVGHIGLRTVDRFSENVGKK